MEYLFFFSFCVLLFGAIGAAIGGSRNDDLKSIGFILGALLGPIGLVIVALLPGKSDSQAVLTLDDEIAKLEARLKELKQQRRMESLNKAMQPIDHDGQIPTYKLD